MQFPKEKLSRYSNCFLQICIIKKLEEMNCFVQSVLVIQDTVLQLAKSKETLELKANMIEAIQLVLESVDERSKEGNTITLQIK